MCSHETHTLPTWAHRTFLATAVPLPPQPAFCGAEARQHPAPCPTSPTHSRYSARICCVTTSECSLSQSAKYNSLWRQINKHSWTGIWVQTEEKSELFHSEEQSPTSDGTRTAKAAGQQTLYRFGEQILSSHHKENQRFLFFLYFFSHLCEMTGSTLQQRCSTSGRPLRARGTPPQHCVVHFSVKLEETFSETKTA